MKPAALAFLVFGVALPAFALAQPPVAPAAVELPAEFARVLRDYEKAWSAGDTAALAALFVEGGYALPSGQPPAAGAAAIRAAYQRNAGSPLALRALHYDQAGDMAYIVGGFAAESGKPDFGKFVLVLRRSKDGTWRIAADIDNANSMPRKAQ